MRDLVFLRGIKLSELIGKRCMNEVANAEKEIAIKDDVAMGTFSCPCKGVAGTRHEKIHIPYNKCLPFTVTGMYDRAAGDIYDLDKIVGVEALIV